MGHTRDAKDELTLVNARRESSRLAEIAVMLRLAAGYERGPGGIRAEVPLAHPGAAARLQGLLREALGVDTRVAQEEPGPRGLPRHVVRIGSETVSVLRRTGLLDRRGGAVRGLPPKVVGGETADHEAVWRAAFLAVGLLGKPGRGAALEVPCPAEEPAHALVRSARRLGVPAEKLERRGQVVVKVGAGDLGPLLNRMGAYRTRLRWEAQQRRHDVGPGPSRLANFDDANQRRAARAAAVSAVRVERALELLGDEVPEHLAKAGLLRIRHRDKTLDELGRLADPPMTKDAIAGRIRRLHTMADKRAAELGVPDTETHAKRRLAEEDAATHPERG